MKNKRNYYNSNGRINKAIKYYKLTYNVPDTIIDDNKDDYEKLMIALKIYALKIKLNKMDDKCINQSIYKVRKIIRQCIKELVGVSFELTDIFRHSCNNQYNIWASRDIYCALFY